MKYAKIVIKNNYEKRGDLVLRNFVRAIKKINATLFLDGDNALLYGIVNSNGTFYEMFTGESIDYDNYVLVSENEIFNAFFSEKNSGQIYSVIENILFGKDINLGFDVSTMEDLAKDRAIEFEAYNNFMSRINPYQKLGQENANGYNDYNNFTRKLEEIKNMIKNDVTIEEDQYEVLENPRVYKKR